jgi:cell division protein FtsB
MLEKFLSYRHHPWVQSLRDVRVVGFLAFGVIVLLVSWNTVGVIQTNYELQKRIAKLEQENELSKLANENLRLKNEYYNTNQYQELSARKQFGMAAPGERVYIVPRTVALKHTVEMPKETVASAPTENPKPLYQQNLEAWADFFFHRASR